MEMRFLAVKAPAEIPQLASSPKILGSAHDEDGADFAFLKGATLPFNPTPVVIGL